MKNYWDFLFIPIYTFHFTKISEIKSRFQKGKIPLYFLVSLALLFY